MNVSKLAEMLDIDNSEMVELSNRMVKSYTPEQCSKVLNLQKQIIENGLSNNPNEKDIITMSVEIEASFSDAQLKLVESSKMLATMNIDFDQYENEDQFIAALNDAVIEDLRTTNNDIELRLAA